MNRFREILRAVGAIAALLVLLFGVPAALIVAVGWPLPSVIPSWAEVSDALTGGPISDATVQKAIALVIWVAWSQVAVAAVVESWSLLHRRVARPAPFTLPTVQLGVGRLLSSALLLTAIIQPRAAHAVPAPPAPVVNPIATTPAAPPMLAPPSTPAVAVADDGDTATKEWVVHQRETLWGIAAQTLGDGRRYREIAELNHGRLQPDGATFTDPGDIRPGWVLRLPADASVLPTPPGSHRVLPGDSLSSIAKARRGDPGQWSMLWELNRDRAQADGAVFTDPNLLHPGWVLELPVGPAGQTEESATPAPSSAAPAPVPVAEEPVPAPPLPEPESTPPTNDPTSTPATAQPAPPAKVERPEGSEQDNEGERLPIGLLGAGLAAAGSVILLDRRRRAALRRRSPHSPVTVPPPHLQQAEKLLRAGAPVDPAVYLDAALRAAAADTGASFPAVRWVEASASSVLLVTDSTEPAPAGFTTDGPGRWRTTAQIEELLVIAGDTAPPTPALTAIGTTPEGAEVLLDLEQLGTTIITGDRQRAVGLLRSIALGVATATWSEHSQVILVGLAGELTQLPSVATAPDWHGAVRVLQQRSEEARRALDAVGAAVTSKARAAGATVDAWHPTVLIGLESTGGDIELPQLPAGEAVAAVICSATGGGRVLHVDDDGHLHLPDTNLEILARSLDEDDTRIIVDLLDPTLGDDEGDVEPSELLDPAPAAISLLREEAENVPTVEELTADLDVLVRVIGEVEAVRLTPEGEQPIRPRKHRGLELLAYLSRLEAPVSTEDISAAMWPGGANSIKTLHNVVSDLRGCLGTDRDGRPVFPPADGGRYHVSERVMTDYAVFRTLADIASALDDQQAPLVADILTDALTLVRGEPFVGGGRGYAWVSHQRGVMVAAIVDAAEEVAEIRLAEGDWKAAECAARQGLRAFPCDERLYRLLMRAAHAAGNAAGVQRVFNELCEVVADPDLGAEPEDTVHPETVALLEFLLARRSSLGA